MSLVPSAPGRALSDAGWSLAHLRGVGRDGLAPVNAAFPGLAEGRRAEEARESAIITACDGLVVLDLKTSVRK